MVNNIEGIHCFQAGTHQAFVSLTIVSHDYSPHGIGFAFEHFGPQNADQTLMSPRNISHKKLGQRNRKQ